jgi:ribose 5-phosphate isomerase B
VKIACAFDHAGVDLKDVVLQAVAEAGHDAIDVGTWDDYPDAALGACLTLRDATADRAVVVCGSGAGVSVACTKLPGVRAAVCHDTYSAAQCVEHDDVNVLCLGARIIGSVYAAHCVRAFAGAEFSGEERHVRRLRKIAAIERQGFDVSPDDQEQR